jgi:acetoacetate decarboxylase
MSIPINDIVTMPAFSPYYPMPPARYIGVRMHNVFFRAEIDAVNRILPDCFEPSEDGLCVASGLTVPWSANYGEFQESYLTVKCSYNGITGYFVPVAFLNSRSSIPAGREIYGTPKVFADIDIGMDERVMYTDTCIAKSSILSIRSTMHKKVEMSDIPDLQPSWRLKVIPKVDGKGVDVMQIIDGSKVATDVSVRVSRKGDGVVEFSPTPVYDLSDFKPVEYFDAYYIEMDFTEGYGEIIHDFLK